MTTGQLIFGSVLAIALPLLMAWGKLRIWEWQRRRNDAS
jgi:hypothetical protein